jgi:dipeptidyl aminopeptidase/acylaminoacyl peptidase
MLRFDFRGCGESEGNKDYITVSQRIIDLGSAIDFIRSLPGMGEKVGLVGSSLGGYLSLIQASKDPRVKAIVIWATPLFLDDLGSKKQCEDYPIPGKAFFEDLPRHRLSSLLPKISTCLVIHGDEDELVPIDQAWEIFHGLGIPKEIHIIEGADHRFTNPIHRKEALDLSVEWLKKYL